MVGHGIIEVTDTGDKKIPQFRYDKISFEVAIEEF